MNNVVRYVLRSVLNSLSMVSFVVIAGFVGGLILTYVFKRGEIMLSFLWNLIYATVLFLVAALAGLFFGG